MFDLFGFWFGVTVLSAPMLILGLILSLALADLLVKDMSRGRMDGCSHLFPGSSTLQAILKDFGKGAKGFFEILVLFVSAFFWVMWLFAWIKHDITMVKFVSRAAEGLAPYLGWVGAVVVPVFLIRVVGRKMFDAYYKVETILADKEGK
jgi:hypothetical protein